MPRNWLTKGERREARKKNQRKHMVSNRSIFDIWRNVRQREIDTITGGGVSIEEFVAGQHQPQPQRDEPKPLDLVRIKRRAARKPQNGT